MVKKGFAIILFINILFFSVLHHAYGEDTYETVAKNLLRFLNSDKQIISAEMLEIDEINADGKKVLIGVLFHLNDGGYILVSPSHNLTPIKAYSLDRPYSSLPENYRRFLTSELEYNIRQLMKLKSPETETIINENIKRWNFLLGIEPTRYPYVYQPGTHLLLSRWEQGYPYNKFLPEIQGKHVLAGCVNVAVAQILRYYRSPSRGMGVSSYTWNSQPLKTTLFRSFNWDNMPEFIEQDTPEYMVDEVAKLIQDLVIVNHTSLGLESSGATINLTGLIEHFGLSNRIARTENNDF